MRIALFIACFNDALFPETGRSIVRIMERLGHEVIFPEEQSCCGQMHINSGYVDLAQPLLVNFVQAFTSCEVIVTPSSSCAATIRHVYPKLLKGTNDSSLKQDVDVLTSKVYEFCEFLTDYLKLEDVGAYYPKRVTYHATCNSLRSLNLGNRPIRLLKAVEGLDYIELQDMEECCGFGGLFAVKNTNVSTAMMTDKISKILNSKAEICAAVDNSCLLHLGGGLERLQSSVSVLHIAEILAHARNDN